MMQSKPKYSNEGSSGKHVFQGFCLFMFWYRWLLFTSEIDPRNTTNLFNRLTTQNKRPVIQWWRLIYTLLASETFPTDSFTFAFVIRVKFV